MDLKELRRIIKGKTKLAEPMKNHTSFHIGGAASIYVEPEDLEDLKKILFFIKEESFPFFILGGGTNILVKDTGFDGIIISSKNFASLQIRGNKAMAGSGIKISSLLPPLAKKGLSGLEFLAGIPGTAGGATLMNAGSIELGIGNFVEKIETMDFSGRIKNIGKKSLDFSYRDSNLAKYFFLSRIEFRLKDEDTNVIKKRMKKFLKKKKQHQPIEKYSAGCIFKNPRGLSAGKLIEEAGLKGERKGDAIISEKHANYIINSGRARAADVLFLIKKIQEVVSKKFRIKLEPEIKII
ncbi:MAG: UDP-N-acetylmuramate dehydrogenase [Candidatus Omnitrophica bacterium]|nr:UDP-N-acetylmuramate dehydrogenase [Candidatus Omnitrophota bacterium]